MALERLEPALLDKSYQTECCTTQLYHAEEEEKMVRQNLFLLVSFSVGHLKLGENVAENREGREREKEIERKRKRERERERERERAFVCVLAHEIEHEFLKFLGVFYCDRFKVCNIKERQARGKTKRASIALQAIGLNKATSCDETGSYSFT